MYGLVGMRSNVYSDFVLIQFQICNIHTEILDRQWDLAGVASHGVTVGSKQENIHKFLGMTQK